jgi:transketolase
VTARTALVAARARRDVLRMFEAHPAGHLGGAMSALDIVSVLYSDVLRVDPEDPRRPDRDRFILSAGHKAMAQYAALAEAGFFPAGLLDEYGTHRTRLGGHPDMHKLPGVEANTGALGHGLSIAAGVALGTMLEGFESRVFVLLGDGELPEGSNWEAAAFAAHHHLDNLIAIVDVNGLQISGPTAEVLSMEPIADKFAAFGWQTTAIDGHDLGEIRDAVSSERVGGRPLAVIARTIKGKGVSAVEGTAASHYWKPDHGALAAAIREADERVAELAHRGELVR